MAHIFKKIKDYDHFAEAEKYMNKCDETVRRILKEIINKEGLITPTPDISVETDEEGMIKTLKVIGYRCSSFSAKFSKFNEQKNKEIKDNRFIYGNIKLDEVDNDEFQSPRWGSIEPGKIIVGEDLTQKEIVLYDSVLNYYGIRREHHFVYRDGEKFHKCVALRRGMGQKLNELERMKFTYVVAWDELVDAIEDKREKMGERVNNAIDKVGSLFNR